MNYPKNEFGVPQYPNGDVRKLFILLAAIDLLERPTISAIADLTSIPREQIDAGVARLREELGVNLHRIGEIYRIESWGEVLKKNGVKRYLKT